MAGHLAAGSHGRGPCAKCQAQAPLASPPRRPNKQHDGRRFVRTLCAGHALQERLAPSATSAMKIIAVMVSQGGKKRQRVCSAMLVTENIN